MSDEKPCGFGSGRTFEVFGEAAASAEPGKGSLNHPASRQELEAFDAEWPFDDLDGPWTAMGERVSKLLATIDPVGKHMPQLGKALAQALQQGHGAMDILNVGGMNVNGQQEAVGVSDDMALAPIDAFAGIKPARPTGLRCRSTLAVNDGGCRSRLASEFAPRAPDQSAHDPLPQAGIAPSIEIALDRRVLRRSAAPGAPLAARGEHETNNI